MEIQPSIVELAREILQQDEFLEAATLTRMISRSWGSKKERNYAKLKLCDLTKPPPSRPLYYLRREILGLPRNTRNCIRYLGDYIDLLTKEMTFEYLNGNARRNSLGTNARRLVEKRPDLSNLARKLGRYADFMYTPAKHDFNLPPSRQHRFTPEEVVFAAYVTIELGKQIQNVSKFAAYAVEKDYLYSIGGRWGSGMRVKYGGGGFESPFP
jgi:hypothetical protein